MGMGLVCLMLFAWAALCAQQRSEPTPPEKLQPRDKARQLLDSAAKMVTSAQPQVQVAALIHLGENYHLLDRKKALEYLEQAFAAAADLPSGGGEDQRGDMQAKVISSMAAVSLDKAMDLLPQLTAAGAPSGPGQSDPRLGPTEKIVRLLLDKKDFARAIEVVETIGSTGEYPFRAAQLIFDKLPAEDPRRVQVFGDATTAFVGRTYGPFADFLSRHWQEAPRPVAEAALKAVLNSILDKKDDSFMQTNISSAKGTVTLNSRQDIELFNVMHVLRALDPKRADELIETRADLRSAVERFPQGIASMSGGENESLSIATVHGSTRPSQRESAEERLRAIAESRAAEAQAELKQDPQRALSLVRGIPVLSMQAQVLGSIASSVSEKDPSTAKSVLDQTMQLLEEIKDPRERIPVWEIVAEAAHRAKEEQRAWEAIDRGLSDAAALYKRDADVEASNEALREYWPSTQAYRRIVWMAAKLFGADAEPLLAKITDPDLALLARIEMARSLLGQPTSSNEVRFSKTSG